MEGSMTLDPKIYRRAAEMLASVNTFIGCCDAILKKVDNDIHSRELHRFVEYFEPNLSVPRMYWMGFLDEENIQDRVLALLFMEQIAMDLMKERRGQR